MAKSLRGIILVLIVGVVMGISAGAAFGESVTAAVAVENTWTDAIFPKYMPTAVTGVASGRWFAEKQDYGTLNLSVTGTWAGTVTLQKAYDFGATWIDTGEEWTANTSKIVSCYEPGVSFRIGIATGDYTSGTCNVRLSK